MGGSPRELDAERIRAERDRSGRQIASADAVDGAHELATAMQYGANVVFMVVNNGIYGTIRMHQEREYPARVYATALANPDFAALARAYGAHGEIVEDTAQFAPAFERALAAGKPSLIELRIDPQAITTTTTLDEIRKRARKGA